VIASIADTVTGFFGGSETGPNAIDLLKTDHDTVEDLFARVKENEDGNNAQVFARIKEELDAHAHIEETIFYPFCLQRGDEELKKIVREGVEEHKQVHLLLAELSSLEGTSPTFKAKLKVLMENVEHHVEEEEDEMFSLVDDQVDDAALKALGGKMQTEKQNFKNGGARAASAQ